MTQVIVYDMALAGEIVAKGETDGKIVDNYYMKINGELYHSACVMIDTSEARCALELVGKATKAANDAKAYANMLSGRLLSQYCLKEQS